MLSGTEANLEEIFRTYQLGASDFMDLKKLMTDLNIKAKGLVELTADTAAEPDLKMLRKRNESTAFNIYQLKVEEKGQ